MLDSHTKGRILQGHKGFVPLRVTALLKSFVIDVKSRCCEFDLGTGTNAVALTRVNEADRCGNDVNDVPEHPGVPVGVQLGESLTLHLVSHLVNVQYRAARRAP